MISQFEQSVSRAKAKKMVVPNEDNSIEVSPEVFDHFMQGQETPSFYYKDVRVFKKGTREEIEKSEKMTVEQKLFGASGN